MRLARTPSGPRPSAHLPQQAERENQSGGCWDNDQAARLYRFVKSQRVGYGLLVTHDELQLPAIEPHVDDTIERLEYGNRRGQTGATVAVATRQGVNGDARAFDGH